MGLPDVYEVSLDCVHCGLCLQQCPTYRVTGLEPSSPRGRIHLMRAYAQGEVKLEGPAAKHLDDCLGCRACETVCPAGVRYGEMFEATRELRRERGAAATSAAPTGLVARMLDRVPDRRLGRLAAWLARAYVRSGLRALVRRLGLARRLPARLALAEGLVPERRDAPTRLDGSLVPAVGERRGRVALFRGCVAEDLFPEVTADAAELLAAAGLEVHLPASQTCCGALDQHAGRSERARELGRRNVAALAGDFDAIVSTSAGCGAHLRTLDHHVDGDGARALAARVRDVTEVLAEHVGRLPLGRLETTVTYDAPCHLLHAQRVSDPPLALLGAIPGLELRPLVGSELCCGGAGIYNLLHPELSARILAEKVDAIRASGARVVATGNPGCLMQIAHGLRAAELDVEVAHPVTLLARAHRAYRAAAAAA